MVRQAWPRLRSRAAVAAVPGFFAARDPGHEALTVEILGPGRELRRRSMKFGGELRVTAHKASPTQALPPGWCQEWRVLRFIPERASSNLIQAINKVCIDTDAKTEQCRNCLLMPYTKSIVSAVMSVLVMVGAPVFESAEERPLKVLCIGLGGGSIPSFLVDMLPGCLVDVVEVEPAVIESLEAMGFQPDDHIRLWLEDGAQFVCRAVDTFAVGKADATGPYDAVIVDAYDADGCVPDAFTMADTFFSQALAAGLLSQRSVLVTNFLPGTDLGPVLSCQAEAHHIETLDPVGSRIGRLLCE
ncbi:unnamed protein product [Durusdinium trenchii]|uniref:Uncharacterized protein n=2 Tax=Durusdinium trenchii TaxID=1381693 RepID=A0ABP0MBG0_9DINO